ncbi:LOW QUALITY PROTEIN: sodium-dependent phosphate transport protein 2A-like [Haliotis rubra]|uniref:LOW QUALITY PROTEIN: sodium-dependent phosphate transport protein 2A-like n=1 Tax=Haliotis rubra TaxID=36100 RepID=UPI001EE574B3|nr:LOW QUALITY PROTEIN: sodium-dependent phosphate transport protein 2A-like [Haliotis rubra]
MTSNGHVNDAYDGLPEKESGYANGIDPIDNKVIEVEEEYDKEKEKEEDPWKVTTIEVEEKPWAELNCAELIFRLCKYILGVALILGFLYMFICSLDFLSSAFKLLGGKAAGQVFQNNEILSNPVAGMMIGVLVTVLVQSSSTSTSIIISMVGADILTIPIAIPIIMGANIGTSVTNTIVAVGQLNNKSDFRRAFAGATVHDMFNWLTVIILLPLEVITGYLSRLSGLIVNSIPDLAPDKSADRDFLKILTKPFTKMIIEVDKSAITKIATNTHKGESLLKTCSDKVTPWTCCSDELKDMNVHNNVSYSFTKQIQVCSALNSCAKKHTCSVDFWKDDTFSCDNFALNNTCCETFRTGYTFPNTINDTVKNTFCGELVANCQNNYLVTKDCMESAWSNNTAFSCDTWIGIETECIKPKTHLFMGLYGKIDDIYIGAILLVISLAVLCICLVCIVKLLNALLKGQIALVIKKFVNADFPGKCSYFTGYLAILLGAGLTILVQSSSIFTSTLTPLVGIGVIELDRMYPLTLGANIGTTTTGILSALAQDGSKIRDSLQVALCHLFFNISGILIFYPFPFFRPPIPMAKFLGTVTAKYRWFAFAYLAAMFFFLPAAVFGLSIPGWYVLAAVLIPIAIVVIIICIVKLIQRKRPTCLPPKFRNWKWLPEPMRSLRPYDNVMQKVCCPCLLTDDLTEEDDDSKKPMSNGTAVVKQPRGKNVDTRL